MNDNARQNFLNRVRIEKDLEKFTGGALSRHGNVDDLVSRIADLERDAQDFVYHWAELVGKTNMELAAHFVDKAPTAFGSMDIDGVEQWLDEVMQTFDHRGLGFAIEAIESVEDYAVDYAGRHSRCLFENVATFLRHFVHGLGGRELRISADRETFTDTDALFLPEHLGIFADGSENFTLYKLTACHLWAQTWYGTWHYQVVEKLIREHRTEQAVQIYNRLECIRLDACLARDLPGLGRELDAFGWLDPDSHAAWTPWLQRAARLAEPGASAHDSLALIESFRDQTLPPLKSYQGEMFTGKVRQALFARVEREKQTLQRALSEMQQSLGIESGDDPDLTNKEMIDLEAAEDWESGSEMSFQMSIDGDDVSIPDHLKDLLGSIMQDFGELPEEHMTPANVGDYVDELLPERGEPGGDEPGDSGRDTYTYREWDCVRQRFRDAFCHLREFDVPPGDESFVDETLDKHRGLLKSIRKTFEAVVAESRLQRRQIDGDDIDIDAIVQAYCDVANGDEMSEYLYTRYRNQERNIAVMFMVDMSGSTLGWVNDAERESLVLLCEALEMLGDRYAIFGFSGRTNRRCEVYRIKNFEQAYDLEVRRRISGIKPKAYTRMGVAIRHLGHLLDLTQARTKLLITLSDGRPEDYGGYKGKYGIEDTRHALLEMKQGGIHPFCITIDNEAQEYLPHMYGAANYAVIDEVQKLPQKVADIYRRLTT